ncbi:O-antigen ligase family protein [Devosia psychrophila]|uniref:O-antigen ligase n=1 Tax=Devosia psychrophila TaxID=728005 RepID=A0A0F5PYZ2_9HYPH|nr:O-antigen ligase [Devosia psychrophila]KKC33830.1 polymerase [Devosia psychrophila]SFD37810.1 O-antigen ligase [Devosia psychrophila]
MLEVNRQALDNKSDWFGWLLFIVVFAYFWIGTGPFPSPNDTLILSTYGDSSNQINQLIVIAMTMTVLAALFMNPAGRLILRAYWLPAAILVWLLLIIPLSDSPDSALRRTVYAALVCICSSAILLLPRDRNQFTTLIGYCLLFALGLSMLGVLLRPDLAIHQSTDASEQALAGDWRGHFGHKNTAAAAAAFAFFFALYLRKNKKLWVGNGLLLLSGIFILNAGGKTSLAIVPAVLLIAWLFERLGGLRLPFVLFSVSAFNIVVVSSATSQPVRDFIGALGIDPTFTDRASIWQLALSAIAERPFWGYGFQSFWQTDALANGNSSAATWAVTAANAHNGYLDLMLSGGFPLLILAVIWLVILPSQHASKALRLNNDLTLTRLFIRIWLFALFLATLESPFFANSGPIWFTILIAIFGLQLQAQARLVSEPTPQDITALQVR